MLKLAPDLYDITVFGAEPHPNYNRILLSPVLAGEQTLEEIVLNDWAWYTDNGITLHAGFKVTQVDRVKRMVTAQNNAGETLTTPYDRLVMATGSNPFILPLPGKDLQGVLAYRDIADTQAMIDAAAQYKHAVVIGGGLLGLEAANGLLRQGMEVLCIVEGQWRGGQFSKLNMCLKQPRASDVVQGVVLVVETALCVRQKYLADAVVVPGNATKNSYQNCSCKAFEIKPKGRFQFIFSSG